MMQQQQEGRQQQPSREVLKWLQGLDLAYAVKSMRRDFANGFLVAEMFSRYFPKLIQMHSYDNALRMSARQDNWRQLELVFAKIGFEIDNQTQLIESAMNSQPGASLQIINAAYTFLTAREIWGLSAGSTASTSKGASKILRGENRQLAKVASQVQVKTGTVNIKSVESGIMALRAAKRSSHVEAFGSGSSSVPAHDALIDESKMMDGSTGESKTGSSHGGAPSIHSPFGILEEAVAAALGSKSGYSIPNLLGDIDCLAPDSAASPMMPLEELESVVASLQAQGDALMRAAMAYPEQWTQLAPRLATVLLYRDNRLAGQILADVGGAMAEEDACTARAVYFKSIFPVMKASMETALPRQRATAVAIYAAYCPPQDRIGQYEALRMLQRHLKQRQTLLACTVTLMNLAEGDLALEVEDPLSRWLISLAVEGLTHSAPSARACSMAILGGVLERIDAVDKVATPDLLFRVSALAIDPWWEVRVQLARVAIAARDFLLLHEALREPERFGEHACKLVCCLLAPVLSQDESLAPLFVRCALGLSSASRRDVLGVPSEDREGLGVFINAHNAATQTAKEHLAAAHVWDTELLLDVFTRGASSSTRKADYAVSKNMNEGEADILLALLLCSLRNASQQTEPEQTNEQAAIHGADSSVDEEYIRSLWHEVYEALAASILRGIADARDDAARMEPLADLVLLFSKGYAGLNVFAHPLWPDVLRKVYANEQSDKSDGDDKANASNGKNTSRRGRGGKSKRTLAPGTAVLDTKLTEGILQDAAISQQDVRVSLAVLVEDASDLSGDTCPFIEAILATKSHK
ncbi:Spermatosis-associated protein 4 [Hondaea fermentalgiana]|uniref:Spermatosis-associated protein 4 n=1 Tax=Hondaea fermentalgiana TaxID=2315210 RepID=A0A2R5GU43_9STRA|nr:Spermatosis-associated protein 4 [Hondaea fermentalgiana]|eukprot:GBG34370.1 Spermatosis-associated protein 4 [Hondaea fermentalgiana]